MTGSWIPHEVEFLTDFDRPELATSPWGGHRWFGYDLVRWAQPDRIVELGTHYGCSYFAFCQALQDDRSEAEVMAIDTWEGEEHSGLYGEEVYDFFTRTVERRFATVNTRIQRSLFDDAIDLVADGSVDILHIDGLHTYDAVSHDYATWKDKVAPNGIVLFHDVAPSSKYGSARFWQEVRETAPGFAFFHSFGLGVLLPNGTDGRDDLLELGQSSWRSFYQHRAGHDLRNRQVIDMTAMIDARDEALAATTRLVDERDRALVEVNEAIGRMTVDLQAARGDLDTLSRQLADSATERAELRRALAEANRERHQLGEAADDRERRAADAENHRDGLAAQVDELHHHLAAMSQDRDAYAANLELYRRALRPVRWASRPPRKLLRRLRHGSPPALEAGTIDDRSSALGRSAANRTGRPGPEGAPVEGLFDADWYLARYPDVGRAGADPAEHWAAHGWREGRQPCPLFDAGHYLEAYPDVAAAGVEPLAHWSSSGWQEGRDPSPLFATDFYRGTEGTDGDPLAHYLDRGLERGRFVHPDHELAVLGSSTLEAIPDQVVADVVVDTGDGAPRSVPFATVADLDADLFTFDLWDTLLARTRPADASKLATARRLRLALGLGPDQEPSTWELVRRRVEIEAAIAGPDNGEYRIEDVLARQLTELAGDRVEDAQGLAGALARAELDDEMQATVPIDDAVRVLDKVLGRSDGCRVAVLSDFYMGADALRELLWHHGIGGDRVEVFSSADLGRSKHRGGALFVWSRERYGVEAGRHVHVGDNPNADVARQVDTGGTAVHVVHGRRRFVGPGQLDEAGMGAVLAELTADLDAAGELRCRQGGLRPRAGGRVTRAAWRTALLPVALVTAAVEDAVARGLDRVHYLSREGSFLARVHEAAAPILWPHETPRAIHLAVSRRSTFGPSLAQASTESLMDLWRMYPNQTPRGLLVSLGADPEPFAAALGRAELGLDEAIDGIHLDRRVAGFLADDEVAGRLAEINGTRREALLGYLAGQTEIDRSTMLVVDVGWRGTVQDNLARLLPEVELVGWYLALFPFLNPQPANVIKQAVGPDGNRGHEFAHMEPPAAVERPWTPAAPSVVDYTSDASGVQPVLDEEFLDDDSRRAISRYQDAVVEAVPTVARWISANGAATDVLRPLVAEALEAYYTQPEPGIADLWFDSAHDDTFGVLNVTAFAKTRPSRRWFGDGLGPGYLRHVEAAAAGSLWPAGYRRWRPVEAAAALERALRGNGFEARR